MRAFLLVLALSIASGASGQPLDLARIDVPASVASGDAVDLAIEVRVRNRSDSNKRYALTAVVAGDERDRWTSSSALVPGASERVPLAWTQAVSGSVLHGEVVLFNTRGGELAREAFEIAVAGSETPEAPPVATPPIGPRPIPGVPGASLPDGAEPPDPTFQIRPPQQTTEARPFAPIDIGFGRGAFERLRLDDPGPCAIRSSSWGPFSRSEHFTLEAYVTNRGDTVVGYAIPTTFQIQALRLDGSRLVRDLSSRPLNFASEPLAPGAARSVEFRLDLDEAAVSEVRELLDGTPLTIVGALQASGDPEGRDNQVRVNFDLVDFRATSRSIIPIPHFEVTSCIVQALG